MGAGSLWPDCGGGGILHRYFEETIDIWQFICGKSDLTKESAKECMFLHMLLLPGFWDPLGVG